MDTTVYRGPAQAKALIWPAVFRPPIGGKKALGRNGTTVTARRKGQTAPFQPAITPSMLILFNKPMGVLSQFTDTKSPTSRPTLSGFGLPPGIYPAGRLDRDSEGLLLLTDDGRRQARIADPKSKMPKTY